MKKIFASVLAVSAIAAAAPASAQVIEIQYRDNYSYRGYGQWQSINARQRNLDRRIDVGVRNGSLTRSEAMRLRAEFRNIAYLEARYRRTGGGLSAWERADLDRRFDRLSARIREERRDWQDYRGYRDYRY